jgi:peptidoglycan/LPS O-acetylase OafA/YrhL
MRFKTLDSLRGIAAFIVLIHHCFLTIPPGSRDMVLHWGDLTPFRIVFMGRPAVIFFFVLSGFVLSLPYLTERQPEYPRFVVKRLCRIYLPMAAAVILSALLYIAVMPTHVAAASAWLNNESWQDPLDLRLVLRHLLMSGRSSDASLDNVMWSLIYELRISLIFPFLVLFGRFSASAALLAGLTSYAIAKPTLDLLGIGPFPYYNTSLLSALVITLHFLLCFMAGIALGARRDRIAAAFARLPVGIAILLWVAALYALAAPSDLVDTAGAALIIALSLGSERVTRLLSAPVLLWLGRISYSLYLVHLLVLLTIVHLLGDRLPLWLVLGVVPPTALVTAHFFHLAVEAPATALGRRLGAPRRAVARVVPALPRG